MNLPDEIKTIEDFKESIFKEKKSAFIAHVYSVKSKIETEEHLANAKKKYYDASHHCFAYKLTDGTTRYSDAGEPSGTAGIRILNAIEHFNLLNQLVIVIRYFGGIKLGVGALGKAYYTAANKVLNESEINTKILYKKIFIESDVDQISNIHRTLSNHGSIILNSDYQSKVRLDCLVKSCESESILEKLKELSRNRIKIEDGKELVYK